VFSIQNGVILRSVDLLYCVS